MRRVTTIPLQKSPMTLSPVHLCSLPLVYHSCPLCQSNPGFKVPSVNEHCSGDIQTAYSGHGKRSLNTNLPSLRHVQGLEGGYSCGVAAILASTLGSALPSIRQRHLSNAFFSPKRFENEDSDRGAGSMESNTQSDLTRCTAYIRVQK